MADAARLMAREIEPDVHLPYVRHVTETVISLSTRALITTIRLDGIAFETADIGDLNDLHAKLNLTLRNLADDRLALWTHLIRRSDSSYPEGEFSSAFARDLDQGYRGTIKGTKLFRNELYLTIVAHPGRDRAEAAVGFVSRLGQARRGGRGGRCPPP